MVRPFMSLAGKCALIVSTILVLALALQPWWLAPTLGGYLTRQSGRMVHFDSMQIGLNTRLQPVLKARGVRIENASWADTRQPLAVIGEARAEFAWSSLFKRPRLIARLTLRDADLDLERQADGLRNWRLHRPDNRGPGHYRIQSLDAQRSNIRFFNEAYHLDVRVRASPNLATAVNAGAAPDLAMPNRLDFSGFLLSIPFSGTAAAGELLTFYDTGKPFELRGQLMAAGATLAVAGQAADVLSARKVDADVAFTGTSLAPFARLIGLRGQAPRRFSLHTQLKGGDQDYAANNFSLRFGASDLAGNGRYAHANKASLLQATLHSDVLDLADLAWLAGSGAKPDLATPTGDYFGRPPPLQMDIAYDIRRLRAADIAALQSLHLRATENGDLRAATEFDLGLADGHALGHLDIDQSKAPRRLAAAMTWTGLRLEALLPLQTDKRRVSGVLHGKAQLNSIGNTLSALTKALSGSLSMSLADGRIPSLINAEISLQGGKILRNLIGGGQVIPITCANLVVGVREGSGSIRRLVLDTELSRTTGTGTIDLTGKTLDLVISSEPKQHAWLVLDKAIHLHGPWQKPQRSLIARVQPSEVSCKN